MEHKVPSLSVVVPVFNSEGSLPVLVERLEPVLRAVADRFELVLVNDGSRDGSWAVVQDLTRRHDWVRGFDLMRNFGQHNALLCGVRAARGSVVLTMDDDLQHPPEELPKLLHELARGYDVVYGAPHQESHGLLRNLASQATKLALQKSMGAATARRVSAFRAFRTHLRDVFADYRNQYVSLDVLLTWGTTRFSSVVVRHDPRTIGQSNYTLRKLLTHALNMVTGFSAVPLQIASITGFACTLLGLAILIYVLWTKLVHGSPVEGFTFLASMVALFSGAQLFALGVLGEYLARMHFRMMDRPAYAVRESVWERDGA
ncbi:MAG: glycosyltransferase [Planctomycetes bacterium]|nr:glycosyltransferase [Planctomycetota bacterium]